MWEDGDQRSNSRTAERASDHDHNHDDDPSPPSGFRSSRLSPSHSQPIARDAHPPSDTHKSIATRNLKARERGRNTDTMAQELAAERLLERHPLQRLSAPSRGASAALHTLGLASFTYSFAYLVLNPNPANDSYGWHMQYLTIIGLSLATATFISGLLADLTLSPTFFQIKNTLSVASAPMECLISVLYWGLRAIDPKLVLPDWAPQLAFKADLSFHAIPAIALVVDLLFFSPPWTIAFLSALGLSLCIAFGYWFWIERCYYFNQFYPYPIFDLLTTPQRIGLFAFSALLMTVSTALLVWLYSVINGKEIGDVARGNTRRAKSTNIKGS